MLRTASWALGGVFWIAQVALAQGVLPEKLPVPSPPEKLPASVLPEKLPVPTPPQPDSPPPILTQPPVSDLPAMFQSEGGRPPVWVHADADYLIWWIHRGPSPTLLTTAPNNGITPKGLFGGIIGEQGTTALFTSDNLDYHTTSGMKLGVGVSLDSDRFWSLELGGFFLPKRSINFRAVGNADGTPLLTVPFLDASSGLQSALDINTQDIFGVPALTGSMTIHSEIKVWGYEANILAHTIRTAERSFDLFAGFRSLGLDESLTMTQNITALQDGAISLQYPAVGLGQPASGNQGYYSVLTGGQVTVIDAFSTRNRFYGGQAGGRFQWDFGRLMVDLTGKVAVGVTQQEATIAGSSTASSATLFNNAGATTLTNITTPGGVFALQNNIGTYHQSQFSIVPEIGLNLGYAVTSWLNIHVGYSALYWSNVARPGAQIDPVLNSKLVPTGGFAPFQTTPKGNLAGTPGAFVPGEEQGRPYFSFRDSAFWAHGIQVGVELRY